MRKQNFKNIFEAIIRKVDYTKNTCEIEPLDVELPSVRSDIPLPNVYTNGNAGLFFGITAGTRIIAATTALTGQETTVILGFLPKQGLIKETYDVAPPKDEDMPVGTKPYPELLDGQALLRGGFGESIAIGDNKILIQTSNGEGISLKKKDNRLYHFNASHSSTQYTNAGRVLSGAVQRINKRNGGGLRKKNPIPDALESNLFADTEFYAYSDVVGLFPNSSEAKDTFKNIFKMKVRNRNAGLSEHRVVVNEFTTDSMFTGFLDEAERAAGKINLSKTSSGPISREPLSVLKLSEHELLELVSGNLVDINGEVLDINYRPISFSRDNVTPKKDISAAYDSAKRISRRGVGFHFQLATIDQDSRSADTSKNFTLDVDKEGVLKLHVPASTDTGNIPFASSTVFDDFGEGKTSYLNKSYAEPVPVLLRDDSGKVILPFKESTSNNNPTLKKRYTGIRYDNSGGEFTGSYFPAGDSGNEQSNFIRVNSTAYHNMYSAAERLIANMIDRIEIPQTFSDGTPSKIPVSSSYERYSPGGNVQDATTGKFSNTNAPQYMSCVFVSPKSPAIYPGGGTDITVAGNIYTKDSDPAYTNEFVSVPNESGTGYEVKYDESGTLKRAPIGGKSANIAFAGAVDLSIGKDKFDGKSLLFDTEGSVVSWLGKDRNNRSLVMQTDGEVLLNIGGSYSGTSSEQPMNPGRLEIRVNVTDKYMVGSTKTSGTDSDYIISISENGIVIAGMKKGKPMVFRNDGKILIESVSDDILLKGVDVKGCGSSGVVETLLNHKV